MKIVMESMQDRQKERKTPQNIRYDSYMEWGSLFDKFLPITLEYQQTNIQTNISVEVTDKECYLVMLPQ